MGNRRRVSLILGVVLVGLQAWANQQYLFSQEPIAVRSSPDPRARIVTTFGSNQSFKIVKWNRYNTLIEYGDGQRGWIKKSAVGDLAPAGETGYLKQPITLTTTSDTTRQPVTQRTADLYEESLRLSGYVAPSQAESAASPDNAAPAENSGGSEVKSTKATRINQPEPQDPAAGYVKEKDYEGREDSTSYAGSTPLLDKFSRAAWASAIKGRRVADFLGGGWRSGNRSKGQCAQGAKETLVNAGVCNRRPDGHAIDTHRNGSIGRNCPGLKLSEETNPWKAPGASLIVYNGYASKVHDRPGCSASNPEKCYGHIEVKIPVTAELKRTMKGAGRNLQIGSFLYCSDFCKDRPTKTKTNNVVAIYELK